MTNLANVIKCGFGVRHTYEGQGNFDTDYVDREIVKKARKCGPNDDDIIIEDVVIETKRNIKDSILAQFGDSGLDNYLKPYLASDTPVPSANVTDEVQDFTHMPDNLADGIKAVSDAYEAFRKLDPELTKGQTFEQFITSINSEKLTNYIDSKFVKKEVEKTDEVNKEDKKDVNK